MTWLLNKELIIIYIWRPVSSVHFLHLLFFGFFRSGVTIMIGCTDKVKPPEVDFHSNSRIINCSASNLRKKSSLPRKLPRYKKRKGPPFFNNLSNVHEKALQRTKHAFLKRKQPVSSRCCLLPVAFMNDVKSMRPHRPE